MNQMIKIEKTPFLLFEQWFADAMEKVKGDPTAMALATASKTGIPAVRMVLLKAADERGFVFYTNMESDKGRDLEENPFASLCFYWEEPGRQVRITGAVEHVSDEEADSYFQSRHRDSRIGAWASKQSRPLEDALALEKRVALYAARYGLTKVPRPSYWSGYRVVPDRVEFWLNKPFRLHERLVYIREGDAWKTERLYP